MIRALPRTVANFLFSVTLTLFGTFVRIPFYDASRSKTNTIDWQIQQTLIPKTMVLCLFTITPIYREIFPIVPKTSHKHHEYHQKDYQCNHTYMYYKKIMFIVYDYPSLQLFPNITPNAHQNEKHTTGCLNTSTSSSNYKPLVENSESNCQEIGRLVRHRMERP